MLRDARHDDKDEEKEKKMATGAASCAIAACLHHLTPVPPLFLQSLRIS